MAGSSECKSWLCKIINLNIDFVLMHKSDSRRLVGDTGLLKQIGLYVSSRHASHVVEPDTDKLA